MMDKIKNLFRDTAKMSDGYHTFEELYAHRDALFLNLCIAHKEKAWWSRYHSDGTEAFGYPWVIVGIGTEPGKQVTYHVNTESFRYWDNFASEIKYVDFAPIWDRHSPNDVVQRLKTKKLYR